MEAVYFGIIFMVWYLLSLWISEKYYKNIKMGKQGLFAIAMIFSPLLAYWLVYILTGKLNWK